MQTFQFNPFPDLISDRLILRKLSLDDAPEVFVLRSDEVIRKYIKRPLALNIEEAKDWIVKILENEKNNETINWAIVPKGETKLIGIICLWNIEKELNRAEVGYSLHYNYFGKGIMNEALLNVMKYGFEVMKLKRIDAYTNKENLASIKLLERNNFSRNFAFEKVYENKEELEYNVIYSCTQESKL
jgi:[ribosomal protein S5]-alanine N-acetyltransferase